MLDDIRDAVHQVRPDASFEFREPYIGPGATSRTTMIRVNDCPMSPARNRIGIIDLRLATSGVAVHADPVMWADDDTPERVAQHLVNTLFGVPQISMDLLTLRPEHRRVLRFWLAFINENRDTLLHGEFRPHRPDLDYTVATALGGDRVVTVRYQPVSVDSPDRDWHRWSIVNADEPIIDIHTIRGADGCTRSLTVYDAQGEVIETSTHTEIPLRITVPTGGLAVFDTV